MNVTILSSSFMVYNLQYTRIVYIVIDLSSENEGSFPGNSCINMTVWPLKIMKLKS